MIFSIYVAGLIIAIVLFLVRVNYRLLRKKHAIIKSVSCVAVQEKMFYQQRCEIAYVVGGKNRYRMVTNISKSNVSDSAIKFDRKIKSLEGIGVDYYFLPFFERFGYLEDEQLLTPVWVYFIVIAVFCAPVLFST